MKTKVFTLFAAVAILAFTSCDKVKTSKFDGTYKCTTTFVSGTSNTDDDVTSLDTKSFTATIDLQEISAVIDGRTSTGDVNNDGEFYLTFEWSIPFIGDAVYELDGTVDKDGNMSGTIVETITVLGGLGYEKAEGTFSGSAK